MAGQERNSTRRAGGNGYPVAANPLRLLFTVQATSCSIRDMEWNAKALKLKARHVSIVLGEPPYDPVFTNPTFNVNALDKERLAPN